MLDITHIHPLLTHFPIALIIVGFVADISSFIVKKEICLSRMGLYLEVLGAIAAIVAFCTGYFLTGDNLESAGHTGEMHETFAFFTLGTILVAAFVRILMVVQKKEATNMKYLSLGLFFLAFVFVSITGFYGGLVVFGSN
jgi:uncharacterized membrane protein